MRKEPASHGPGEAALTRGGKKSTTVDVGDCEHADSDQRQLMADLVYGGFRHAVDCSRGCTTPRIEIAQRVSSQATTTSAISTNRARVTRERGIRVPLPSVRPCGVGRRVRRARDRAARRDRGTPAPSPVERARPGARTGAQRSRARTRPTNSPSDPPAHPILRRRRTFLAPVDGMRRLGR